MSPIVSPEVRRAECGAAAANGESPNEGLHVGVVDNAGRLLVLSPT
jgi:hypothetical protein